MRTLFQLTALIILVGLCCIPTTSLITISTQSERTVLTASVEAIPSKIDTAVKASGGLVPYMDPPITGFNEQLAQGLYDFTLHTALGDIIYYNQEDIRWSDSLYGSDPIITHGCGPTILAMLVASYVDSEQTPKTMANWAYANHYYSTAQGSFHSIIPKGLATFGFQVHEVSDRTPEGLLAELKSGKFLVALMGEGHFTAGGHFLLITGVTDDGNLLIADPKSFIQTGQEWDPTIILEELRSSASFGGPLWSVELPQ